MEDQRTRRGTLAKYTNGCVKYLLRTAYHFRLVPFKPVQKEDSTTEYQLFTRTLEWIVYYTVEVVMIFLTFVHVYSCAEYVLTNGMNARCALCIIYALAYFLSTIFSLSNVFYGRNACLLLNTVQTSQSSELFKDLSWESDEILQLFAIQIFPLVGIMSLLSGFVFPVLYPDGPWLLLPKIPFVPEVPTILLYMLINPTLEFLNLLAPNLCIVANSYILMIGYTVMKLSLRRLR